MMSLKSKLILDKVRYTEFIHLISHILEIDPIAHINMPLLPTWHWIFTHETPLGVELGEDGHPKHRPYGVPENFVHRLWVESIIDFGESDLKWGQSLDLSTKMEDVILKKGKSGPLAFAPISLHLTVDNNLIMVEQRIGAYRPKPILKKITITKNEKKYKSEKLAVKSILINEIDLFRYSMLLKVYHRIHYDKTYATDIEGHPGLLVHGPLLGHILISYALFINPNFNTRKVKIKVHRPNYANQRIYLSLKHDKIANLICVVALNEKGLQTMEVELAETKNQKNLTLY